MSEDYSEDVVDEIRNEIIEMAHRKEANLKEVAVAADQATSAIYNRKAGDDE